MDIEYSKEALKYLNKLDAKSKRRLNEAFYDLSLESPKGDIKPIEGQRNLYRVKIGNFRALFSFKTESNTILITRIGPRGGIYKYL